MLYRLKFLFSDDSFENLMKKSRDKFVQSVGNSSGGHSKGGSVFSVRGIALSMAALILAMWLSTGFYTLQPDEEGVVLRFGSYARTGVSGLNYKIPSPIETVTKLSVTRVNREEVGFHSKAGSDVDSRSSNSEVQMLTGDENIVDIDFDVQWRIKDAKDFLFNIRELPGENTVRATAESVMRDVIANSQISDAIAGERYNIEYRARQMLQESLDSYHMGVEVLRVQMLRVEPPSEVIDAYRDVQSAKADHERQINKAIAHSNDIIPRARGQAESIIQDADGYKEQQIALAHGKSSRFAAIYKEYTAAKSATRTRIYYETMAEVLQNTPKVLVDKSAGVLPYLPLHSMNKIASEAKTEDENKGVD